MVPLPAGTGFLDSAPCGGPFHAHPACWSTTILPELRARAAEGANPAADAEIIWYHPGFCQFALPAGPGGRDPWRREIDGTSVAIEPGSDRDRVPGGVWLRRLLMYLCDTALRGDQVQVALGEDAAALAATIDPALAATSAKALEAQVAALLSCRIIVSVDGGPGLSVLDARGRPRAVALEWRQAVRLNARFLDSLARDKVALDRAVITALHDSALALDIYASLALALPEQEDQTVLAESWPELQTRFGAAGQDADAFQAQFGEALARLRAACPALEIEDDAIGVGFSARTAEAPAPIPARAPVVVPPPVPAAPAPSTRLRLRSTAPAARPPVAEPPEEEEIPEEQPEVRAAPPPSAEPRAAVAEAEDGGPPRRVPVYRQPPPPEPLLSMPPPGQPLRQTISLKSHVTGLAQVVWLQRSNGRDGIVIEVTPGGRYDPALVTVLALEPIVLQIAGGLHAREFERVATWATANRDLIDAFWEDQIDSFEDIMSRVKKVPAPGWR